MFASSIEQQRRISNLHRSASKVFPVDENQTKGINSNRVGTENWKLRVGWEEELKQLLFLCLLCCLSGSDIRAFQ